MKRRTSWNISTSANVSSSWKLSSRVVDRAQQPLDRRPDHRHQQPGDEQDRQQHPGRQAGLQRQIDEGDAEVGAQRIERAAREVDDLLHAEHQLQPGGHQKQHGGMENAAEQDVADRRHGVRCRLSDLELRRLQPLPEVGPGRLLQVGSSTWSRSWRGRG